MLASLKLRTGFSNVENSGHSEQNTRENFCVTCGHVKTVTASNELKPRTERPTQNTPVQRKSPRTDNPHLQTVSV